MCLEHLSSGPGYSCLAGYNFCIHDSCAGHPQKLSSPEHHAHPLVLVQTRHDATLLCDICIGSCATGCFLYRCPPCGFDIHPACVRLPRVVRSSRHPEHDLTLVVGDGSCAACNHSAGRPFYYRCTTCRVDFHVSCAATLGDNSSAGAHHQAGQDVNSQVQQARAAHLQSLALQAELLGARFRQKGMNAALDLLSPASYPDSTVVRREYFF
ncbi:hypothetical protein QOZ80_7AG0576820 [Eleusine coracana subsp. coracana]|nr:hypothetical protein QOZ80_7AG0576820 [Eleusine coracana subsp. coracana]